MFDPNKPHSMELGWLSVGANDVAEIGHDRLQKVIDAIEWIPTTQKVRLPMSQGLGLQGIISAFQLNASAIGYNDQLAPFTLLAVQAEFKEGRQRLYCIDKGSEVTPVRSDFYRNVE
jgi:hypothetical protein